MKKLLFILPAFLFTIALNAQTEDEVYIGKGKTFGNYNNGRGILIPDVDRTTKPVNAQTAVTGIVLSPRGPGQLPLTIFQLKKADGTIITIGTKDNGFTVPGGIVGKTISVEGKDAGEISGGRKRRDGVQFIANGIMVID